MAPRSNRRNILITIVIVALIIVIALLLTRCLWEPAVPFVPSQPTTMSTPPGEPSPAIPEAGAPEHEETLTPASLTVPGQVAAGVAFLVTWTGPDNRGDYLTIVQPHAADNRYGNYRETKDGASLELTAPIEPGAYEVRYVTGRSHTILGRANLEVVAADATIDAPSQVVLGSKFTVSWTGPNNQSDYITIVPKVAPDEHYDSYVDVKDGSPTTLTAPTTIGDAEVRYVAGQGRKVLARRPIQVVMASVTLDAPEKAIAGTTIHVSWNGPNNAGDYITIVPVETPDGQYGNYADTSSGSPLPILMPIMAGDAELRYMTGQGRRVLARRLIRIVAAEVRLSAPAEGIAGTKLLVTWTGPNNRGDYITIVAKDTPDGRYGPYTQTSEGSPLAVELPAAAGDAEIRYMTGQGNKVLARIPIKIVAAHDG